MYLTKVKLTALVGIASLTLGIAGYNLGYQTGLREGEASGKRRMAEAYDRFAVQSRSANNECLSLARELLVENLTLKTELAERVAKDEKIVFLDK